MSITIPKFDPTQVTYDANGSYVLNTGGHNQNEQLVLYNTSLMAFNITFLDKTTDVLPPSWAKSYKKKGPIGNITLTQMFTLNLQGQPLNVMYGTIYEQGEHIADVNIPLQYVYAVGNNGGVPVSGNTLFNTGNAPGTAVIEINNSNETGANYVMKFDNSGNLLIQTDNGSGTLTNVFQVTAGSTPAIQFIGGEKHTYVSGSPNQVYVDLPTNTNYSIRNNGTTAFYMNSSSTHLAISSGLDLLAGGVSRMEGQDAVSCGSGTSISHGMGTTPNVVVATPEGTQAFSATVGVGNIGSSTFQATVGAGSAINWLAWNI